MGLIQNIEDLTNEILEFDGCINISPETVRIDYQGFDEWQRSSTKHHEIYFQPSMDEEKLKGVYFFIDRIYEILEESSPESPDSKIKAFLVDGGRACCGKGNVMQTDADRDFKLILANFLHEETHLFNFAFLGRQGWWAGEFSCVYYSERLLAGKSDLKKGICSKLPNGPSCSLSEIDLIGEGGMYEALAAFYFFEKKYGKEILDVFRTKCLVEAKKSNGGHLPDSAFEDVFGKKIGELQKEWLRFYGW